MAKDFRIVAEIRNAQADAAAPLFNGGYLRLYDGTKPAVAGAAITTQNQLAELGLGNPAFESASLGVLTAEAITPDPAATGGGVATWFRAFKADGTTALCDGTVGTSGADLNLSATTIQAGAQVGVDSWSWTVPEGS